MRRNLWEYSVSRRAFFRNVGFGSVGLGMALLGGESAANARAFGNFQPTSGGPMTLGLRGGNAQGIQLPFWGDGALWDQPPYYETIQASRRFASKTYQSADIDNDGQDELIGRGPGGILVNRYNAEYGQWMQMTAGPRLSDSEGWGLPWHYQTIQCADIDGDHQAEIIGRNRHGIIVWKYDNHPNSPTYELWNQMPFGPEWSDEDGWIFPWYYQTIQCADIDGDGAAELIARNSTGIIVWKYDIDRNSPTYHTWISLTDASHWNDETHWSDANGWNLPQYYETIQCADIDGDEAAELIARNQYGIIAFKYDYDKNSPTYGKWNKMPYGPTWSDADGWILPWYFQTIQCADIDGDSVQELFARGPAGIIGWKYDKFHKKWNQLAKQIPPYLPALSDKNGWFFPWYYQTIQFADVDGDGAAELIARGSGGVITFDLDRRKGWQVYYGPALSDAANWNQVQYYTTIQTANVLSGGKTRAALIARSAASMQTWLFDASNATPWANASADFPQFTGERLTAYNFLTKHWDIQPPQGGVRSRYNDEAATVQNWHDDLSNDRVPPPPGVPEPDWTFVYGQIENELGWVLDVNDWYGNHIKGLINDSFIANGFSLQTVGSKLNLPSDDKSSVALSALSLLFNGAWAVLGLSSSLGEVAAVAGLLSTAFSAAATSLPNGGGSFEARYSDLQEDLSNAFSKAKDATDVNQFAITGGMDDSGNIVPGDYGLLAAIGAMIDATIWDWKSEDDFVTPMQRSYATSLWQALAPAKWTIAYDSKLNKLPADYPAKYSYTNQKGYQLWITTNPGTGALPAIETLSALFDSNSYDALFPLGVAPGDLFEGDSGWPTLNSIDFDQDLSQPPYKPVLGVAVRVKSATLTRDAITGELIAAVTLQNRGLTGATNVEIVKAEIQRQSGPRPMVAIHCPPRTRLAAGKSVTLLLRFPAHNGASGPFRITFSGRYRGGGFSFRVPVTLP